MIPGQETLLFCHSNFFCLCVSVVCACADVYVILDDVQPLQKTKDFIPPFSSTP